jgi:NADH-quinone oxidoreductase subunit C
MAQALIALVKQRFPTAVLESHSQHGDDTVVLDPSQWKAVAEFLFSSPQADMALLVDLTAVDYPEREPRFEVVAHLYSLNLGHRLRLKARVGDEAGDNAEIDSLTDIWASANWAEREAYDMFGVIFRGHPDLRRILLYPEFTGYPLRRDYPAEKIQPLVPYRELEGIEKVAPFGPFEGMSFGRQVHARAADDPEDSQVS